jgi:glyoxylase I family protein
VRIEHLALNVSDPPAMAEWYVRHLGLKIVRQDGPPVHCRFLGDADGHALLELYHNAAQPLLDLAATAPATLHLAFETPDIDSDRRRLVAAGATALDEVTTTPVGDRCTMLRDPFGLVVQLVQRQRRMLR